MFFPVGVIALVIVKSDLLVSPDLVNSAAHPIVVNVQEIFEGIDETMQAFTSTVCLTSPVSVIEGLPYDVEETVIEGLPHDVEEVTNSHIPALLVDVGVSVPGLASVFVQSVFRHVKPVFDTPAHWFVDLKKIPGFPSDGDVAKGKAVYLMEPTLYIKRSTFALDLVGQAVVRLAVTKKIAARLVLIGSQVGQTLDRVVPEMVKAAEKTDDVLLIKGYLAAVQNFFASLTKVRGVGKLTSAQSKSLMNYILYSSILTSDAATLIPDEFHSKAKQYLRESPSSLKDIANSASPVDLPLLVGIIITALLACLLLMVALVKFVGRCCSAE
ncbi:MAG: hypothetical protein KVP17_005023 [Porospora cf. gigantea B]|uniref:uncharacterized protein n=1 Tax=Porospora cf. gigantea B TaxID=2853592 RepID=UPI0035717C70|nr:MAG: hypothetical protein KVP17_005023 [Porospora cf. gigantea B]